MAYREDLSAALARVAALERELSEQRRGADPRLDDLRDERDALRRRLEQLETGSLPTDDDPRTPSQLRAELLARHSQPTRFRTPPPPPVPTPPHGISRVPPLPPRASSGGAPNEERQPIDVLLSALASASGTSSAPRLQLPRLSSESLPVSQPTLPTLYEHNRSRPPLPSRGKPMGVLCPSCAAQGDSVELLRGSLAIPGAEGAVCPSCAFFGFKRVDEP